MKPLCQFDNPEVLDCTVTAIPAKTGSPLQVVASLPGRVMRIHIIDQLARYVDMLVGADGQEEVFWVLGNQKETRLYVDLPAGSRISLRSKNNSAISTGTLCCLFFSA